MITKLLKQLQLTYDYTQEELNDIQEAMEEFGNSCYDLGFKDGCKQFDIEEDYYKGFAYGKKEDQ